MAAAPALPSPGHRRGPCSAPCCRSCLWCCTGNRGSLQGRTEGKRDGGKIVSRWSLRLSHIPRLGCFRQNSALCPVCTQHRLSCNLAGRAFFVLEWGCGVLLFQLDRFPIRFIKRLCEFLCKWGERDEGFIPVRSTQGCWLLVILVLLASFTAQLHHSQAALLFFCVLGDKIQEKLQKDRSTTCSEAAGSVSQGRTISGNPLPAIDHKSDVVNNTLIWSLSATAIFVGVGTSFGCRYFEKQPSFPHCA